MDDLFHPDEFDAWAASYDHSINENSGFPFDGYSNVLQTIVDLAAPKPGDSVLDLGTGTGNLMLLFAQQGCDTWGLDFSGEMLAFARAKLPNAIVGQADLRLEWPSAFQRRFDCIVSAYTFHHFLLGAKVELVKHLLNEHLSAGGRLVIGDIAFRNAADEDVLRRAMGQEWEQEYYWLAEDALLVFTAANIPARFIKVSTCAGVFQFGNLG